MNALLRELVNQLFVATNIASLMFGAESEMVCNFALALETYSAIVQYNIEITDLDLLENIIDTQEMVCHIYAKRYGETHDKTRESIKLHNALVDEYNALL